MFYIFVWTQQNNLIEDTLLGSTVLMLYGTDIWFLLLDLLYK